ncbi:MAG: ChbG/HpnK family deacetylase [Anaerolineae bacterium]|nr:MAG: ChbG/HpnK family deacetylase [Anaerolineae bacterium]
MMPRRLIVNGDDFGKAEGTVPATTALYEAGVVTSTTAMVNQPHWGEAAAYLRGHPGLGAGVHLVLNDGRPILPAEQVPSLVDADGCFRDGAPLLLRYGRLRISELEAEWRAQIVKFVADTGRTPDHLDLHCHFPYVFPAWFRVSLKLAQDYGHLPVRLPFDDGLARKAAEMSASYGYPSWYIRWQGRRYQRLVAQYGLARPNYFEMSFSQDGHRTAEHLFALLDALPDGVTELLTHPGAEGYRKRDTRALLDPRVKGRIGELGVELVDYRTLASEQ